MELQVLKPRTVDDNEIDNREPQTELNCSYCENSAMRFLSEKLLNRHIQEEHLKEHEDVLYRPMHCDQCPKIFYTDEQPDETKKSRIKSYEKLKQHKDRVHNETTCSECGKTVKVGKLYYHIKQYHTANENKNHHCPICNKGFTNKHARDDHLNVHTGERPYTCKYCPATFASQGTLGTHQRAHLGIKRKPKPKLDVSGERIPCHQCGKLVSVAQLKVHEQRHHVESQCAICGKMITNAKMKFHVKKNHQEEL